MTTSQGRLAIDAIDEAVRQVLSSCSPSQRAALVLADGQIPEMNYRPGERAFGVRLGSVSRETESAIFRVWSSVLTREAFAQLLATMSFETMVDFDSCWRRSQSRGDYWFGIVAPGEYSRDVAFVIQGHHVALALSRIGESFHLNYAFFGAVPARITSSGTTVINLLGDLRDVAERLVSTVEAGVGAYAHVPEISLGNLSGAKNVPTVTVVAAGPVADFVDGFRSRFRSEIGVTAPFVFESATIRFAGSTDASGDHYVAVTDGVSFVYEYLNRSGNSGNPNHLHAAMRPIVRENPLSREWK